MTKFKSESPRERLVRHVQRLESLAASKAEAAGDLADAFKAAQADGYDPSTLRVVLKLRQLTPAERKQRRALEAIYLAALGMLEGDALPDEARRRLDGNDTTSAPKPSASPAAGDAKPAKQPPQRPLALKDPEDARREGGEAAAAGKRIYDNPFPAGDPCRASWDEGWCAQRKSHGMEPPAAYQRRTEKPAEKSDEDQDADDKKGAA